MSKVDHEHRPCCHGAPASVASAQRLLPEAVQRLVGNHREFLHFLERRVGDRALAEDLLQEAFARGIDRIRSLRQDESAVAWFYRALRNAAIDQRRRNQAAARGLEALARELEVEDPGSMEAPPSVCRCVSRLANELKPEYAEALQAIEVGGVSVKDFAERRGLTPSNAAVRVFRAREALRRQVVASCGACAELGCSDCTCST